MTDRTTADSPTTTRECLVTGGAGFIGTSLVPKLLAHYDSVVIVDNMHPQVHGSATEPPELLPGVTFVHGDVTDPAMWQEFLRSHSPAGVVHLAAETGTGQSLDESTRHAHVNIVGTTVMLDAFGASGQLPERIVLASSRAVYGEGAWVKADGTVSYPGQRSRAQLDRGEWDFADAVPTAMDARTVQPSPVSVYGATKLAQEHILRSWCAAKGVQLVVLRLQNVFGPGQSLINSYTGIVSLFCRIARDQRAIPLYEDGEVLRDFILIDDVTDALAAAANGSDVAPGPFDIGSGEARSIRELATVVARHYGSPEPVVTGQYRHGDVRHAFASIDNARDGLGWAPSFSFEEGAALVISWVDSQLDTEDSAG